MFISIPFLIIAFILWCKSEGKKAIELQESKDKAAELQMELNHLRNTQNRTPDHNPFD